MARVPPAPARSSLTQLPPELVSQIISHAPSANFLRNLSLTNRSLHEIVEAEGWSTFVNNRFPSVHVLPQWRSASHALAALSRNIDRKAFIAQDAGPDFGHDRTSIHQLPGGKTTNKWERSGGQTMGYQPVIDSDEVWTGGTWDARREVVAWGAGAEVIVKIEERGGSSPKHEADGRHGRQTWLSYKDPEAKEGLHDITALRILKHSRTDVSRHKEPEVKLMVGRASGGLQILSLSPQQSIINTTYDTNSASVQCADTSNTSKSSLLAACLGDSNLALFPVHDTPSSDQSSYSLPKPPSTLTQPISQTQTNTSTSKATRIWSLTFLTPSLLATGRGISHRIVDVYSILPTGISDSPIRSFSSSLPNHEAPKSTSAYPIIPLPRSSHTHDSDGDLFLSGGYDGIIRLHDMRSPADCVATISDPVDTSAVFSLATVGRERVIAGAAAHGLLKIFDLRMPGGRAYSYLDAASASSALNPSGDGLQDGSPSTNEENASTLQSRGTNIYTPRTGPGLRRGTGGGARPGRGSRQQHWTQDSPIYSLSRPSPCSPKLYVGLENRVLDFNFTAACDPHPDPMFAANLVWGDGGLDGAVDGRGRCAIDPVRTWDPYGEVLDMSMYEQTGPRQTKLVYQKPIAALQGMDGGGGQNERLRGYDERWHVVDNVRATAMLGDRQVPMRGRSAFFGGR